LRFDKLQKPSRAKLKTKWKRFDERRDSPVRIDAYIVYLFLMLRGFNGGCKDQNARSFAGGVYQAETCLEHLGLGNYGNYRPPAPSAMTSTR
jgi:hypothetical protein